MASENSNRSRQRSDSPLIQIRKLSKYFKTGGRLLKAVENLNFDIYKGETIGLVGESGCGKSTAGRTILRLYEPTAGEVILKGKNIFKFSQSRMKQIRKEMQIIFQNAYNSLNPRMTVENIIGEPLDIHNLATGNRRRERVEELLNLVGLNSGHMNRFPHEFSGGQIQRIAIARALATEPEFIVCDEPVSALDVSVQLQIVNLLKELQARMGLTCLFIAHDLSIVRYVSDRILVMYLGRMFEFADRYNLYEKHYHPYTQALLSAALIPDPEIERKRQRIILQGDVPSPLAPPDGCAFHSRCPKAMDICKKIEPRLTEISPGHYVACHLYCN